MQGSLRELVHDALLYMKDPLLPKQTLFGSSEDDVFFKENVKPIPPKTQPSKIDQPVTVPPLFIPPQQPLFPKEVAQAIVGQPAPKNVPLKDYSPISHIKKTVQRIAPALKLFDQIPDDGQAKKIASSWKENIDAEVVIFRCDSSPETLRFLQGLAKAIDQHLAKVKILNGGKLEQEKRWELFLSKNRFRLIIASDGIQKLPDGLHMLSKASASFLILSPVSAYQSQEHKALLWKQLCQQLKS
jgi:hypothetical protein